MSRPKLGFSMVVLASLLLAAGIASGRQVADGIEASSFSESRASRAAVEIPGKRTLTSRTYRLPDGGRETRIAQVPINYRDANGAWKPIETQLERGAGGSLSNAANSFDLRLPRSLSSGAVRLSGEGGEWISSKLIGESTADAEVNGSTASYSTGSGATLSLSSVRTGVKETIEMESAAAPSAFSFELDASADLTPVLDTEGAVVFRDGNEEVTAGIPPPTIIDSAPDAAPKPAAVHYELDDLANGNWRLDVVADRKWLADPKRVWPVKIDPTTEFTVTTNAACNLRTQKYTYYREYEEIVEPDTEGSGACGSPGASVLRAGLTGEMYETGGDWEAKVEVVERERFLLRFNLSSIPADSYVGSATLNLQSSTASENTTGVMVKRVTKQYGTNINWHRYDTSKFWSTPGGDTDGTVRSEVITKASESKSGQWSFQGLGPLVRSWVSSELPNDGLLLLSRDEGQSPCDREAFECSSSYARFHGAGATTPNLPTLVVKWYPPAPSTSTMVSPGEGTRTAANLRLKAAWTSGGVTGISFQFREGNTGQFKTIPSELIKDAEGKPVSFPVALSGVNESATYYFDAAHATSSLRKSGGPVQVRALFESAGAAEGYSEPVEALVSRSLGGPLDAEVEIGPGGVDLLTGNLTVSRPDVAIPGFSALSFSRTFSSRDAGSLGDTGVLGQGWEPGVPVSAAGGAEWRSARVYSFTEEIDGQNVPFFYVVFTDLQGNQFSFEKSGETFKTPDVAAGWELTSEASGTRYVLADPKGNRTTFEKNPEWGGPEFVPVSVSALGGEGNRTRMVYQVSGGEMRLSMIIAPTAAGVTCTEGNASTTKGCRSLTFTYAAATTWGAPSGYGDRLSYITYYAPGLGGSWQVAKYKYDEAGRLIEVWDPRISPSLVEKYSYHSTGQLKTVTPAGEEPWTLEYGTWDEEVANGRLIAVKRPSLVVSPSASQTTIVYGVPLSGGSAPYQMDGATVDDWGQTDIPVSATAVFPPDQVPTTSPPSSYARATLYYMDVEGQAVNTATPAGAGTTEPSIRTHETDIYGNTVRELTPANRLRALAAGAGSAALSKQLDTKRVFTNEGTEMVEEWGPRHSVLLKSGATVEARFHRVIDYDEGAPTPAAGMPWPHLPTRESTSASISGEPEDADIRVIEKDYDWELRKPSEVVVDPLGLNLRTRIEYDSVSGLPTEQSLPEEPSGGDAHTSKIIYYTAGYQAVTECQSKPEYANLPCKTMPAAQPGTEGQPELVVRKYPSYTALGSPTETVESPGGGESNVRRVIATFDEAGRPVTIKREGGGTSVPKTETVYGATSGLPEVEKFICESSCGGFDNQAVTMGYDGLGRITSYKDADGNESTTTYDALGRPLVTDDGQETQTHVYDANSGLLVEVQDSEVGNFTASYDADGVMTEYVLPNGLASQTTVNEAGEPVHLTYEKTNYCSSACDWIDIDYDRSINGQILSQSSSTANQLYSYDNAGRLTLVKDSLIGGACTTREYGYDKDSNRTSLVTRLASKGSPCSMSGGTTKTYTYDDADRLLGTGLGYDAMGRITTLPSSLAGGSALTTTYFSTDMVATQSQGSITNTYQLDAALRHRQRVQTGGLSGTEILHYASGGDSVAWSERESGVTRNVTGINGELAAIAETGKETLLQLTDLHGDVVAQAELNPMTTELTATFEYDEYGNPKVAPPQRYGWHGGQGRRTELPSGVIQMGARSYVPSIGRFLSVDPVTGGSANAYDYAEADPVNGLDLDGSKAKKGGTKIAIGNARAVPTSRGSSQIIDLIPPVSIIPSPAPSIYDAVKDAWNKVKAAVGNAMDWISAAIGSVAAATVFERSLQFALNALKGGARQLDNLVAWVKREFTNHIPELVACATAAWQTAMKGPPNLWGKVGAAALACTAAYRDMRRKQGHIY